MRVFFRFVFGLLLLGAGLWLYRQSQDGGQVTFSLPQWNILQNRAAAPAENPYAKLDDSAPTAVPQAPRPSVSLGGEPTPKAPAPTAIPKVPTSRPWESQSAGHSLDGALWLTTARPVGGVKLTLDGQNVPVEQTLPHRFRLPPLAPGKHTLRVLVWDEGSRELLRTEKVFAVK
ncbi:hypothetical protein WDJ50_06315 [Deinococcus sp. VB142]|uniref:PEGA domain-containing protein n=1 Tax=Deinococcus sp. VB142 TaxID=3112952 RepID=A0AAU6Q6E6_9DEIO